MNGQNVIYFHRKGMLVDQLHEDEKNPFFGYNFVLIFQSIFWWSPLCLVELTHVQMQMKPDRVFKIS